LQPSHPNAHAKEHNDLLQGCIQTSGGPIGINKKVCNHYRYNRKCCHKGDSKDGKDKKKKEGTELAELKNEALMSTNGIEGALEETRRMIQDHLNETQRVPVDEALSVLHDSLREARDVAASSADAAKKAEQKRAVLADEVARAAEASRALEVERGASARAKIAILTDDLAAARNVLQEAERREADALEMQRTVESAAAASQRSLWQVEMGFRAKLEELWRPLRWQCENYNANPRR